MLDSIQKIIMAGIGAAAVTADRVEKILNELVEQGKITAEEAKKTAEKIMDDGKKEFNEAREDLNNGYEQALKKLHLVTQEQFRELEARVRAIEEKLTSPESGAGSE